MRGCVCVRVCVCLRCVYVFVFVCTGMSHVRFHVSDNMPVTIELFFINILFIKLKLLRWARANGCAWDAQTRIFARSAGHSHVLAWANEHGCPE